MASPPTPSTAEIADYVASWRSRARILVAEAKKGERLREQLPELVRCLRTEFGAKRVLLIGSLARGEATGTSDIDLLVYGIPAERVVDAWVRVDHLAVTCGIETHVDLVPAELVRPEVVRQAEAEGIVLWEERR